MITKGELESALVGTIRAEGYEDCGVAWRQGRRPKAYWFITVDSCTRAERDFDTFAEAVADLERILDLARTEA